MNILWKVTFSAHKKSLNKSGIDWHFCISLNVWLNRRQWIFMSASEFSLLQHDPFKSMKRIWHSQIQNGKGRSILIAISVNCGCLSLILYQNLTSDNFLKVSCSVESEIVLINFYTLTLRFICLSCTLNESWSDRLLSFFFEEEISAEYWNPNNDSLSFSRSFK